MTLPAAFLFDMDGLLLDTERLIMQVFLEQTDHAGIDHADASQFFLTLIGTSSVETTQRLKAFLPASIDVTEFDAAFRSRYAQRIEQGIPLRPHAKDVLTHLNAAGARLAVVTSTHGVPARRKLTIVGLLQFFEHVRAGDEVRAGKPDPAPYLQAAEALGVDPTDCVAFEDSDPGITAAMAAGCRAFQIPDLRPPEQPLPDLGQGIATDLGDAMMQLGLWH